MVEQVTRDGETWFECEACGMLFDVREDAGEHERHCDAEDPSYIA
jgi:uncharacterized C2H2 Zn-finger protein